MPSRRSKPDIITFKVDAALRNALRGVPNRSAFIRTAILSALENACPLCGGSGALTPNQKEHWTAFATDHRISECVKCHETHLVCASGGGGPAHGRRRRAGAVSDES